MRYINIDSAVSIPYSKRWEINMKQISQQMLDNIIEDYNNDTLSNIEIEKKYGLGNNTLRKILRNLGVGPKLLRLSNEQKTQIIEYYLKGVSSEKIASDLGFDGGTIRRVLKSNNIQIRPATQNKRRYTLKEDLFEIINNETSSYFLGLMYADGNLSKNSSGARIDLSKKDKDILLKLSSILYKKDRVQDRIQYVFNEKTQKTEQREYSKLCFYSQKIHKDLVDKGCVPNKTFTISFNEAISHIPENLINHFIRGYFDGDGCICIADLKTPRVDITSNIKFITELSQFVENKLNINASIYDVKKNKNPNTKSMQINHNRADVFLEYIYKNANLYMNRKKQKYDTLLAYQKVRDNIITDKYSNIFNYGTTYIPTIKGNQLTSKYVETIKKEELSEIIDETFKFYRNNGFPYVKSSNDTIIKEFNNLCLSDMNRICKESDGKKYVNISNKNGNEIFKHFSPHFYEASSGESGKISIYKAFHNDELLKKCITNRITRNEGKDGENKFYNINGSAIRKGFESARLAFKASVFNTVLAKYIYETFTKDGDIVYDYSMGFGQRLIGSLATKHKLTYVGVDPYKKSYDSNCEILKFFKERIPGLENNADLYNLGSEDFCPQQYHGKVSLAFSSPPYFDQEVYEENTNQAYMSKDGSGSSYDYFINTYWRGTMNNISKMLKQDGLFLLNVKDEVKGYPLSKHMLAIAKENGFEVFDTYYMVLSMNKNFNTRGKNDANKLEPIYCLKRI